MKRRTRVRIFRSAVTGSVVGLVIVMAAWSKDGRSGEHRAAAAQSAVDIAATVCRSKLQSESQGRGERWQRDAQPDDVAVAFAADAPGKTIAYRCDAGAPGLTVAVGP